MTKTSSSNTITLPKFMCLLIGFLLSPFAPVCYILTPLVFDDPVALALLPLLYMISMSFVIVLGLPIFLLLHRLQKITIWSTLTAGAFSGAIVAFVISYPSSPKIDVLQLTCLSGFTAAFIVWLFWTIGLILDYAKETDERATAYEKMERRTIELADWLKTFPPKGAYLPPDWMTGDVRSFFENYQHFDIASPHFEIGYVWLDQSEYFPDKGYFRIGYSEGYEIIAKPGRPGVFTTDGADTEEEDLVHFASIFELLEENWSYSSYDLASCEYQ